MSRLPIRACYISIRNFSHTNFLPVFTLTPEANNILDKVRVLSTPGHLTEALSLFYNAPPSLHSQQTYTTLFHACALHGSLKQGQHLHQHMLSHYGSHPFDLFVTNHLINMYCKFGLLDNAQQLFDEMLKRNLVSWTALISGYAQHGHHTKSFSMFSGMLLHFRPNDFTFASVLSSCDYVCGKQVHALVLKMCFDAYVFVANALVNMYSKNCGSGSSIKEAWKVFENMEFRNVISWNSMIAGFQYCKSGAQAINLFFNMRREGIGFDRATILSVLTSLCGSYDMDVHSGLKFCFQLHCLSVKTGFISEIEVATALVKAYSDLGGDVSECYRLFLERRYCWDIVSWTGIITALAGCEPEEALFLFRQLRREGLTPDWCTFSIALKACAGLMTERHASTVHSQVVKAGFEGHIAGSSQQSTEAIDVGALAINIQGGEARAFWCCWCLFVAAGAAVPGAVLLPLGFFFAVARGDFAAAVGVLVAAPGGNFAAAARGNFAAAADVAWPQIKHASRKVADGDERDTGLKHLFPAFNACPSPILAKSGNILANQERPKQQEQEGMLPILKLAKNRGRNVTAE
ncbi:hypothetical protein Patl1_30183 [Pistacia atlantica]|uniref:Uncharacterized protein n=1 Tax=Pistacia atlantica TaxID=434234 RepID=A0ACC1AEX5_9ROSI|nr:hypothetical protein Patl1_30183 [Pistacia atlantica]